MLQKHFFLWIADSGAVKAAEHQIDPESGTNLVGPVLNRPGPAMEKLSRAEIDKMLTAGVIEPAAREWASPVAFAPKNDGTLGLSVHHRRVSTETLSNTYLVSRLDDRIDSLGIAAVFSTLNCSSSYWQSPAAERDKNKTPFTTHVGAYRCTRMPFGLKYASTIFQHALDIIPLVFAGSSVLSTSVMSLLSQRPPRNTSLTWAQ